jgi:F-type H+-transporting ATPase subunit b
LSIDLWTAVLTIASFFLLYFLLNTFLYKPVLKFMDDRKARIDAGLEEGKKAKQADDENRSLLDGEIRKSGAEAKQLIAEAKSSGEEARSEALSRARDEAAGALKEAALRIEEEKRSAEAEAESSMPEYVAVLAARLLGDEAVVAANAADISQCVGQAND